MSVWGYEHWFKIRWVINRKRKKEEKRYWEKDNEHRVCNLYTQSINLDNYILVIHKHILCIELNVFCNKNKNIVCIEFNVFYHKIFFRQQSGTVKQNRKSSIES